jgi:MtN3 and saliva related transmembrane protein
MTELIGFAAGTLTTVAFVPQVILTWRLRSAGGLSLWMLLCTTTGIGLWLIYGITLRAAPVIVANAITFVLAMVLLVLKFLYRRQGRLEQHLESFSGTSAV